MSAALGAHKHLLGPVLMHTVQSDPLNQLCRLKGKPPDLSSPSPGILHLSSCFGPRCQPPHGQFIQLCPGASYPSIKGTPGTPNTPSVSAGRGLCFSGSAGTCPNSKQHSAAPFSCDEAPVDDPKVHKRDTLPSY